MKKPTLLFYALICMFLLSFGCGVKGDPLPPKSVPKDTGA